MNETIYPKLHNFILLSKKLVNVVRQNDIEKVKQYLSQYENSITLNGMEDLSYKTPLSASVSRNSSIEIANLLLRKGADVNAGHASPLMTAAMYNTLNLGEFFVKHGADVNAQNSEHITPLMIAAEHGYLDFATLLLENGADVSLCDYFEMNAMMWSCRGGNPDIFNLLLKYGAVVDDGDGNWTPLMLCAHEVQTKLVERLLELGANVNAKSSSGNTAMILAQELVLNNENFEEVEAKMLDIVKLLYQYGGKINAVGAGGRTALIDATSKGLKSVVEFYINNGAKPNKKDFNGDTALIIAVKERLYDIVAILLKEDVDLEDTDAQGDTALSIALKDENEPIQKLLLDHGANINAIDSYFRTRFTLSPHN